MSKSSQEAMLETINQTGFPLQIAVAQAVKQKWPTPNLEENVWSVLHREHAWRDSDSGGEGFLDLVVENGVATSVLALECKRVRDASWLFLHESGEPASKNQAKLWLTQKGSSLYGWRDLSLKPTSHQCEFCTIHGERSKARQNIEPVAAKLVAATEALAREEAPYVENLRMYASAIVTTAKLYVARFDAKTINLPEGEIVDPTFDEVPSVRFRKQLSMRTAAGQPDRDAGCGEWLASAKEHTVFIVNAAHIVEFLSTWEIDSQSLARVQHAGSGPCVA